MKVLVRREACAGHARCNHVAPAFYPLDDNGYIDTAGFDVQPGQALARRGVRACPERIIQVVGDSVDD